MTSKLSSWTLSTSFTPRKLQQHSSPLLAQTQSAKRETITPIKSCSDSDTTLLKSYSQALRRPPSQSTSTITRSMDSSRHQVHAGPESSRHTLKHPVSQTSRPSATTSDSTHMATKRICFTHQWSRFDIRLNLQISY